MSGGKERLVEQVRVSRTIKKRLPYIWLCMFCGLVIWMCGRKDDFAGYPYRLKQQLGEKSILGSLEMIYPVMDYMQNPHQDSLGRKMTVNGCYGIFPIARYICEEGDRALYATQMESSLTEEEIREILHQEATDENRVDEEGKVITVSEPAGEEPVQAVQANGQEYSVEMLTYDFLLNHFYTVDSTTTATASQLDAAGLLARDMTMKGDNSKPQILIYHTHSQEGFVDSVEGDPSTTVVGVGDYLTRLLEETYGYQVIHNTTSYDLVDGKLDRNEAYTMALPDIQRILEQYPSIEVVIDLHRDGIDGNKLVTDVNGKPTAQLMFFNGMSYTNKNGPIRYLANENLEDNLAFSLQLQLEAAKYYPGVMRKIYLKGYRYNLHVRPKAILVESGAQNNTLQEQLNAMEVLADVLNKVLSPDS